MEWFASAVFLYLSISVAAAADLNVLVLDRSGKPVVDAVVLATTTMPTSLHTAKDSNKASESADVVQINKEFVPYVTVVKVGSVLNFPNKDNVRHHVYSFSLPKKFELPLYAGTSAPPVLFDNPGVIVIGCNIHDWMIGYIYVAETPYFVKTGADGAAILKNLPTGKYVLRVWHPDAIDNEEQTIQAAEISGNENADRVWHLDINARINPRHASTPSVNSY